MSYHQMPICYHPTRVVLVDDNQEFLVRLKQNLIQRGISCVTFDDPDEALIYLEGLPCKNKLTTTGQIHEEDAHLNSEIHVSFDLKNLHREVYNAKRFAEVSVVVADYEMPQMKGDTFFGIMSSRYIKRIMLTGGLDHPLAIRLLNQKLIDNFAEKKPTSTVETIVQQIHALQLSYFNQLSAPISGHLFHQTSYVTHSDYCQLVMKLITQYQIIEHYTFSQSGNKFMLDSEGKVYALVIMTEDEAKGYYDTAYFADAAESLVSKLHHKTHMPFLFTQEELDIAPQQWEQYLIPVEKISLKGKIVYYGVTPTHQLNRDSILSFTGFLEQ